MGILAAGTELEQFARSSNAVLERTTSGSYDTGVVRCAIGIGGGGSTNDFLRLSLLSAVNEVWCHFENYINGGTVGQNGTIFFSFDNASNVPLFRLHHTANTTIQPQYWNGSSYVNVGTAWTQPNGSRGEHDIHVTGGASFSFEWYINGTLFSSGSAAVATVTNITQATWNGSTNSSETVSGVRHVSQCIVADESTVGWKYYLDPATGNGAETAWLGVFTDINELALNDATMITANADAQRETYTKAARTIASGSVKAVVVSARAKRSASGPQNLRAVVRKGGTNYETANLPGLGVGFNGLLGIFENDPSTGSPWTLADAGSGSLEFGVRAAT